MASKFKAMLTRAGWTKYSEMGEFITFRTENRLPPGALEFHYMDEAGYTLHHEHCSEKHYYITVKRIPYEDC